MVKRIALLLFSCFIAFCSFSKTNNPTDTLRKAPVWVAKKGPIRPTRTLKNDILHTQLDLRFDWLRQHALGSCILYTSRCV